MHWMEICQSKCRHNSLNIPMEIPKFNFKFDWSSSTNLLCNGSSINASYHSNHELQPITQFNNEILIKLYTFLHSNHKTNKLAVAHKTILQRDSLENFEFVASSLANVLSSVGNADSQLSLCQLYGIFRSGSHIN